MTDDLLLRSFLVLRRILSCISRVWPGTRIFECGVAPQLPGLSVPNHGGSYGGSVGSTMKSCLRQKFYLGVWARNDLAYTVFRLQNGEHRILVQDLVKHRHCIIEETNSRESWLHEFPVPRILNPKFYMLQANVDPAQPVEQWPLQVCIIVHAPVVAIISKKVHMLCSLKVSPASWFIGSCAGLLNGMTSH